MCNGALALMALVRGEGDASDANRLRLADAGGIQVIADGGRGPAAAWEGVGVGWEGA